MNTHSINSVFEKKVKKQLYSAFILVVMIVLSSAASAAFYSEGATQWNYRAPIGLPTSAAPGSTIIIDIDFADLVGQTTAPGTLDINSIRLVKSETVLVAEQEFNDTVFMSENDAVGNGRGEVRFILEDTPGNVDYHVYFDITANGTKPVNPAQVINGTFEQTTGNPTGWTQSSQNAGGRQNNETYSTAITSTNAVPAGCSTGGATVDNSPSNNGTVATGTNWHLLGYRDRCEDGAGNELIRLTRNLRVPAGTAAGRLEFSFQVQAWDGIASATNYDWFTIYLDNTPINHRNMGVVAGNPALSIETGRFGRTTFSTGIIDYGWRNASIDLSPFQNSNVSLRFEARFSASDNAYRTWIKIDDVVWSAETGKVGVPELDTASAAYFVVRHSSSAIYCLPETIQITVMDAAGNPIEEFTGTVGIDTQQGSGQFSLISGNGVFTNAGLGSATYTYTESDQGVATFSLNYSSGVTPIDIDAFLVSDTAIRDDDTEGLLAFSASGLTFTAAPLGNPPLVPLDTIIPAQIAGTDFPLYVTAYGQTPDDSTCGVIESYTGNKTLNFWHTFVNPTTGTLQATIDGTAIAVSQALSSPQTINFSAGQTRVEAQYPDVGEINIEARDLTAQPTAISGNTSNFVVKPASLTISRIAAVDGSLNPAANTLTGTGFVAAGEAFVVDIDALNANGVLTPNFGRESISERVSVRSETLILPIGGRNGSINDVQDGSAFSLTASAGRSTNTTVSFDETGIISLRAKLLDDDYLGAGDVTRPIINNVGRFYPDRFELVSGSVTASCTNFTYMGEPNLNVNYELNAVNVAGALVTNYSDDLYGTSATADLMLTAENADDGLDLSTRLTASTSNWESGEIDNTIQLTFSRLATPDGPYTALTLGARILDSLDNKPIDSPTINSIVSGDCSVSSDCNAVPIDNPTSVIYGRTLVLPAQGPETAPLTVGLVNQFFNGAEFELNALDQCSTYASADTTLSGYTGNLQSGETSVISPTATALFVAGKSQTSAPVMLSAPGLGNTGTVELSLDVENWLTFDWLGSGEVEPTATATFGGFRGHDRVIYWREQR